MFDQVLVRPQLLGRFRNETVRIVERVGKAQLLDRRGIPDASRFSDHLPVLFRLDL